MEKCGNNKEEAEKLLSPTLPEYVTFQTLDFINEVKTTRPIPWINEFEDITSVKREIQKKMLNELAELFLIKNRHFETVIESFNKVMDSLSSDKQKEVLQKINATKEITDAVEKLEEYKVQIIATNAKLEEAKSSGNEDKAMLEKQIDTLKSKVSELEKETLNSSNSQFYIQDGQVRLGNPNYVDNGVLKTSGVMFGGANSIYSTSALAANFGIFSRKCDNCSKLEHDPLRSATSAMIYGNQFNTCPTCNRNLCSDCWPRYNTLKAIQLSTTGLLMNKIDKCPKCIQEGK
jgi:hypothetical protein